MTSLKDIKDSIGGVETKLKYYIEILDKSEKKLDEVILKAESKKTMDILNYTLYSLNGLVLILSIVALVKIFNKDSVNLVDKNLLNKTNT